MNKAVFIDRDGTVNEMVYHHEHGIIDSPFVVEQFKLLPGVGEAIKIFRKMGYKLILISNQPGIAKGHMSEDMFGNIGRKMKTELAKDNTFLDAEYYCQHHPEAKIETLKIHCECRKPKPGLLFQAAKEMDLDLSQSWMVGDGLSDIQAGKGAGVKTILIGRMKCELCHMMDNNNARPKAIVFNLKEASQYILNYQD